MGVMNRVDTLADRPDGFIPDNSVPFRSLIPLDEVIADVIKVSKTSKAVGRKYSRAIEQFGTEFRLLLDAPENEIRDLLDPDIARAVINVRNRQVEVAPGFDGEYGTVKISADGSAGGGEKEKQLDLFSNGG